MDLEDRMNLIKAEQVHTVTIRAIQVFNSIISTNLPNIQQYKENLTAQLKPIYTKIGPWGPELIWQMAAKYKMSR